MDYKGFFKTITGHEPYPYQKKLGEEPWPDLLNIPTGLGKTAGVVLGWIWKRLHMDPDTPIRLIYCLPMRVLVEQTYNNVFSWLERAQGYFQDKDSNLPSVHLLMGGEVDSAWTERPELPTIIIGTQDMLLSRALMRGYGMSRYQWPVHFALLHNDTFWVFDEVQLMGSGLTTSAQLEGMRREIGCAARSSSLWLSATLNPDWLDTVDMKPYKNQLVHHFLSEEEKQNPNVRARREAVKNLSIAQTILSAKNSKAEAKEYAKDLAREILQKHCPGTTTLVVLNTVERSQVLMRALQKNSFRMEFVLVHARFRPAERKDMERRLGKKPAKSGRIVVSTQAVEAGVDMTSRTLFTELAPWSSLVQRFGRCNRYGEWNDQGGADVFWIDMEKEANLEPPYQPLDIEQSRTKLQSLDSASACSLPPTDQAAPQGLVLRQKDFLELFNTDPDLSGFDIDISPYIRDVGETDVQVFWRELDRDDKGRPLIDEQPEPAREELCRASLIQFQSYLSRIRKKEGRIFVWDSLESGWVPLYQNIRPGLILMLDAGFGGYDLELGFLPGHIAFVKPLMQDKTDKPEGYSSDYFSLQRKAVLLSNHLHSVHKEAQYLCSALGIGQEDESAVLAAASSHDLGKAHPAFQNMLLQAMDKVDNSGAKPWAKSDMSYAGKPDYFLRENGEKIQRLFFRHELASMLAWLALHAGELQADLIAYLIAAHHGKVRMGLRAQPGEVEPPDGRLFARGVWDGDVLPEIKINEQKTLPQITLHLDVMRLGEGRMGPSWTARIQELLTSLGPFRLAWLEALVRLADQRGSRSEQED